MAAERALSALAHLQSRLQTIYDVHVPLNIGEHVFSDARVARELGIRRRAGMRKECMVLRESNEALECSVYFTQSLMERLGRAQSGAHSNDLTDDDIHSLIEGVSHFVFLVWNARHDRPVALFDLELQAEVDKFVVGILASGRRERGHAAGRLYRLLFDRASFDSELNDDETSRYVVASRLAGAYCRQLRARYIARSRHVTNQLLPELRRFYRLRRVDRFHRITSCA